jgi:hypothetical protein
MSQSPQRAHAHAHAHENENEKEATSHRPCHAARTMTRVRISAPAISTGSHLANWLGGRCSRQMAPNPWYAS